MAAVIVAVQAKGEKAVTNVINFKDAGFTVRIQALVVVFRALFDPDKEFCFTFFRGCVRGFWVQVSMVLAGEYLFLIDHFFFLFYLSSRIIYLVGGSGIHAGLQGLQELVLCGNRCPAYAGSFQ